MGKVGAFSAALSIGLVALVAMPVVAAAESPSMTSRWEDTDLDFEACRARMAVAVRQGGFTKNVTVNPSSIYAERGNYTALVRCLKDKGVVFFAVAGPDTKTAERYNDGIADKF